MSIAMHRSLFRERRVGPPHLRSCERRLWKHMRSCRTPFWSMNPARSSSRAANARRISGFKSNRSILLPLRNRLNRLGSERLCHQQPVVCEIAGEKGRRRSMADHRLERPSAGDPVSHRSGRPAPPRAPERRGSVPGRVSHVPSRRAAARAKPAHRFLDALCEA